jgi:hypothetical protein
MEKKHRSRNLWLSQNPQSVRVLMVPFQTNHTGTVCGRPSGRVVLIQIERKALSGRSTLFQGIKPDKFCSF